MAGKYVEANLVDGERLVYEAHLHWIIFAWPMGLVLMGILILLIAPEPGWGVVPMALGAAVAIPPYIAIKTSEFAVTNRRVLIKVGWLRRNSLELMLEKVESITVDQSLDGRALNFGTIGVRGTGGSRERFRNIAKPLQFRREVQALIVDSEFVATAQLQQVAAERPSRKANAAEVTKKCPHCLSDIPVAATACRFCARDA